MKIISAILSLLLIISVSGCASGTDEAYSFVSMDTVFSVKGDFDDKDAKNAAYKDCVKLAGDIENAISVHLDGAEGKVFCETSKTMLSPSDTFFDVLSSAVEYSAITGGTFDPTIGALTELWNISGGGPVPNESDISSALSYTGTDKITVTKEKITKSLPELKIDLGAIGKGYSAQKLCEKLSEDGAKWGIVSAGRTVGVFGDKPDGKNFKIGICDPNDTSDVIGYIYTDGGFISVSGDYERYFEENGKRYHHIIDPSTGYPTDNGLSSVAVTAHNGSTADMLSTALFVMGKDKALDFYKSGKISFEAIFTEKSGVITVTDGLCDESRFEMTSDKYTLVKNGQ